MGSITRRSIQKQQGNPSLYSRTCLNPYLSVTSIDTATEIMGFFLKLVTVWVMGISGFGTKFLRTNSVDWKCYHCLGFSQLMGYHRYGFDCYVYGLIHIYILSESSICASSHLSPSFDINLVLLPPAWKVSEVNLWLWVRVNLSDCWKIVMLRWSGIHFP